MSLILTVDVGNTRAKFGLFEAGPAACPQVRSLTAVRLDETASTAKALKHWLESLSVPDGLPCIIAGSNPPERDRLLADWPSTVFE